MNAFTAYAERAAPRARKDATKAPSELEQKLAERNRLHKGYRKWKREQARAALKQEPRLKDFVRYLRKAESGDELIEAVETSWLPQADIKVRLYALRMVSARCDHINRQNGFEALDDPFPYEPTTYFRARDLLYPGGRS